MIGKVTWKDPESEINHIKMKSIYEKVSSNKKNQNSCREFYGKPVLAVNLLLLQRQAYLDVYSELPLYTQAHITRGIITVT